MIEGVGPLSGQPLHALPSSQPVAPPKQPPPPPPSVQAPTIGRDQNLINTSRGSGHDLGPLPFEQTPQRGLSLRDWHNVAVASHQAGMGGMLDVLTRDVAQHAPELLDSVPLAVDQRQSQNQAAARWTLAAAQGTRAAGFAESTRKLALLAGETAKDRPAAIAAFKVADAAGGRTEAEHILFRTAQRAQSSDEALATARRAVKGGYGDSAKFAYFRAAQLAPTAEGALAAAREASAAGLKYEGQDDAFAAWKGRLHEQVTRMEGPGGTGQKSPFQQLALAKARYINPYIVAMLKTERRDYPRVAAAARAVGETEAADVIASRARLHAPTIKPRQ